MNAYFMNINSEERKNILDKHKELYNGYATHNIQPSEQPLYTQDFANDKNGVTVNGKGDVKSYTNVGINEDVEVVDKYEFIPVEDNEEAFEDYNLDEISDEESKDIVREEVEKSLDMFKRFKNFN